MSPQRPDAPLAPPPVQLTRFVGREREVAEVRRLLGAGRLLTLTGAGGSGKTRLAVESVAGMDGGVAWADLAPVLDPEALPRHVFAALGVRMPRGGPAAAPVPAAMRERPVLLVLDNCEHVVDAAARLADAMLREWPALRILATSREALGVAGEVAWLVPTLTLPPADADAAGALEGSEAVELFAARARDALPSFALDDANAAAVARICRRLDGLPLALELAAARVHVLSPAQIAERLGDRFRLLASGSRTALPRHRTLHEVIAWSYNLLPEPERALLRRLSVFVDDFSLDAAEAVCSGDGVEASSVLDGVAALASKSLVVVEARAGDARYRLLESVRDFARERLREAGAEARLRARHAAYFLARAEETEPRIFAGGADPAHLAWFDAEQAELRGAAEWFADDPDGADAGLRLAGAQEWFWARRGRMAEGRAWLEAALRRAPDAPAGSRARALAALALLAYMQDDVTTQRDAAGAAAGLLRDAGRPDLLTHAVGVLGAARARLGEVEAGRALLDEAVERARGGDPRVLVTSLALRGSTAEAAGDLAGARESWAEALERARTAGLAYSETFLADALARLAVRTGDLDAAQAGYRRSLAAEAGDPRGAAAVLQRAGCLAALDGDPAAGARLLGAAEALRERIGAPLHFSEADVSDRAATVCREALGEAALAAAWSAGRALDPGSALELARSVASGASATAPVPQPDIPDADPSARAPSTSADGDLAATSSPDLAVRALGPLEIDVGGEPLPRAAWTHARPRELLLHLLCHRRGRTRDQVGLVFWPDASPAQAKNSFHVLLHRLRRTLGNPALVVLEEERYRINPALDVRFDAAAFEDGVAAALRGIRAGDGDAAAALEHALELYRGDFLADETVGDWYVEIDDRLRRLRADALSALADARIDAGDVDRAARTLERLVRAEELREDAHRRLMLCYARGGRRELALRQYDRVVAVLRDELDAEPEPETDALAERIRAGAA